MRDFGIMTKSFAGAVNQCPFHAARIKIDKVPSVSTKAARIGLSVHRPVASIRQGNLTLDAYLLDPKFHLVGEFEIEDRDDICAMVQRAFTSDPIVLSETEKARVQIERYVAVDAKGQLTRGWPEPYHGGKPDKTIKNPTPAIFHGSLDRLLLRDDGSVIVDDLKTGRWPADNPIERYGYVTLAKAVYPQATHITFAYHYLRSGNYMEWHYEWKS